MKTVFPSLHKTPIKLRAGASVYIRLTDDEKKARRRAYYEANKERILAKQRATRSSRSAQAKEWREKNKEHIAEYVRSRRNKVTSRDYRIRWREKQRTQLGDEYVKKLLNIKQPSPAIIELKRKQLLFHRITRQLNETIEEKNNGAQ